MSAYGISHDHSMVIDREGVIQYSEGGVSVSNIQNSIDDLLATAIEEPVSVPLEFDLKPNYPNPFNPITTIAFTLPNSGKISLKLYDVHGRFIKQLTDDRYSSGHHRLQWDGTTAAGLPAPSGTYFYQLRGPEGTKVRKMILVR